MEEVEQYSEESGHRLEAAGARLAELVRQYALDARAMHGGSSEMPALFERNRVLARAVADWNERAFDHTGTSPLLLEEPEKDDFEDEEADEEPLELEGQISVVSRWDLGVVDSSELIAAGRAAHRRNHPEETEADATVAVADAARALYAIAHAAGEPWYEVPGVEVLSGARVYLVPDGPLEPLPEEPEEFLNAVAAPSGPGRVLRGLAVAHPFDRGPRRAGRWATAAALRWRWHQTAQQSA